MSDVFISYAREDREVASRLADRLKAEGWTVFSGRSPSNRRRMEKGGREDGEIQTGLLRCGSFFNGGENVIVGARGGGDRQEAWGPLARCCSA